MHSVPKPPHTANRLLIVNRQLTDDLIIFPMRLLAVLLPPFAVFLEDGLRGHFWLNLLLTLCFYIPGMVHALVRCSKKR